MKPHTILRAFGILGIVSSYGIFVFDGGEVTALIAAISGIVGLISPEVLDQLPVGPNKP